MALVALHTHRLFVLRDPNHTAAGSAFRTISVVTDINYRLNYSFRTLFNARMFLFIFFLSRCSALNVQSFLPLYPFSSKRISDSTGLAKRTKEALQLHEGAPRL